MGEQTGHYSEMSLLAHSRMVELWDRYFSRYAKSVSTWREDFDRLFGEYSFSREQGIIRINAWLGWSEPEEDQQPGPEPPMAMEQEAIESDIEELDAEMQELVVEDTRVDGELDDPTVEFIGDDSADVD